MCKRREKPRILRLAVTALAATGLLSHGLAMLLIGLLAAPVAANSEALYFGDICTPDGIVGLADLVENDSGSGSEHHGSPLKGCPVCTAFAQIASADLPTVSALPTPQCCGATQRPLQASATRFAVHAAAQPRAPPAII